MSREFHTCSLLGEQIDEETIVAMIESKQTPGTKVIDLGRVPLTTNYEQLHSVDGEDRGRSRFTPKITPGLKHS